MSKNSSRWKRRIRVLVSIVSIVYVCDHTWWQEIHLSGWPLEVSQSRHCCFLSPKHFDLWNNCSLFFILGRNILNVLNILNIRLQLQLTLFSTWNKVFFGDNGHWRGFTRIIILIVFILGSWECLGDLSQFCGDLSDSWLSGPESAPPECVPRPQHPAKPLTFD